MWYLVPRLPRSVGLGPVSSPPRSARTEQLSTTTSQAATSGPARTSRIRATWTWRSRAVAPQPSGRRRRVEPEARPAAARSCRHCTPSRTKKGPSFGAAVPASPATTPAPPRPGGGRRSGAWGPPSGPRLRPPLPRLGPRLGRGDEQVPGRVAVLVRLAREGHDARLAEPAAHVAVALAAGALAQR